MKSIKTYENGFRLIERQDVYLLVNNEGWVLKYFLTERAADWQMEFVLAEEETQWNEVA